MRNFTGRGSAGSECSRMSRSKCAIQSLATRRPKAVLRPPDDRDAEDRPKNLLRTRKFADDEAGRRGRSVSRDARGGPNPDRFRNNGKICIKLADSRGKRPGLAVPGGMEGCWRQRKMTFARYAGTCAGICTLLRVASPELGEAAGQMG